MSFRNWCFTWNNYDDKLVDCWIQGWYDDKIVKFVAYSREVGENKTPHIQGYCATVEKTTLKKLKQKCGNEIHWEAMRGRWDQNEKYCSKQGELEKIGICPAEKQGQRSDLKQLAEELKAQPDFYRCVDLNPHGALKYLKHAREVHAILHRKRKREPYVKPNVYVFWGKTGTDKSKHAYAKIDEIGEPHYVKSPMTKEFFEYYMGERVVLFDDFRGSHFPFSHVLLLLDGYGTRVAVKGSSALFKPHTILMTSCKHPRDWYPNVSDEDYKQLERRITEIRQYPLQVGPVRPPARGFVCKKTSDDEDELPEVPKRPSVCVDKNQTDWDDYFLNRIIE